MQLLSARDFKSAKTNEATYLTIALSGVIAISPAAGAKLKLAAGDKVIITLDKEGDYHIGKATAKQSDDAFILCTHNHGKAPSFQFNAKALVSKIVADKDLAVHPNKKKSVRLDINFDAVSHWSGVDLFQIITE